MKHYKVKTHFGEFFTTAKSTIRAKWNVIYRLYGKSDFPWEADFWEVVPCA